MNLRVCDYPTPGPPWTHHSNGAVVFRTSTPSSQTRSTIFVITSICFASYSGSPVSFFCRLPFQVQPSPHFICIRELLTLTCLGPTQVFVTLFSALIIASTCSRGVFESPTGSCNFIGSLCFFPNQSSQVHGFDLQSVVWIFLSFPCFVWLNVSALACCKKFVQAFETDLQLCVLIHIVIMRVVSFCLFEACLHYRQEVLDMSLHLERQDTTSEPLLHAF